MVSMVSYTYSSYGKVATKTDAKGQQIVYSVLTLIETTFNLTGMDPSTASLSGWAAADDSAVVKLNGVQLASIAGFGSPTNFSLSSSFVAGVNTLDFVVTNGGSSASPTGLRVEVSGSANSVGGGTVATPTFNPAAGTYSTPQSVVLSTATSGR